LVQHAMVHGHLLRRGWGLGAGVVRGWCMGKQAHGAAGPRLYDEPRARGGLEEEGLRIPLAPAG
jgi:hypothetical protein